MGLFHTHSGNEIIVDTSLDTKINLATPSIVDTDEQWITFANIACRTPQGDVFDYYREVQLRRDYLREDGKAIKTPINSIATYCHEKGLFLPSSALFCNLLVVLFENREVPEVDAYLTHFFKPRSIATVCNTVIHWPDRIYNIYDTVHGDRGASPDSAQIQHFDSNNKAVFFGEADIPQITYYNADHMYGIPQTGKRLFGSLFGRMLSGMQDASVLHEIVNTYRKHDLNFEMELGFGCLPDKKNYVQVQCNTICVNPHNFGNDEEYFIPARIGGDD